MDQPEEKRAYLGSVSNSRTHATKGDGPRIRPSPTPPAKPVHPIIDMFLVRYRVDKYQVD